MKYLLTRYTPIVIQMTLAIKLMMIITDDECSTLLKVAIHKIRSITSKSWTISIPMLNLPEVDSISSLSPRSFNTTIVLLKANHTAKKHDVMTSNHKNVAMK